MHVPCTLDIPDHIETDGNSADGHSGSSKLENDAEKEEKYEKDTQDTQDTHELIS